MSPCPYPLGHISLSNGYKQVALRSYSYIETSEDCSLSVDRKGFSLLKFFLTSLKNVGDI
jgi:hypothetical protein